MSGGGGVAFNYDPHAILTSATAVVIFVPPEAPITSLAFPFLSTIMLGFIEERGLLPGAMKLAGDGCRPKKLITPGDEKSSITLFMTIPVLRVVKPAP